MAADLAAHLRTRTEQLGSFVYLACQGHGHQEIEIECGIARCKLDRIYCLQAFNS